MMLYGHFSIIIPTKVLQCNDLEYELRIHKVVVYLYDHFSTFLLFA
jgi:hypothetical protein